ncbi:MAG: DUF3192 domain-containing protein [Colwellia sp.]|nr:DUF3192 domain-containing protein [Colwellia sp.]
MKKSLFVLLIALPLAATLSGCIISVNDDDVEHRFGSSQEDRTYENRKKIAQVELGSNFIYIQEKLGVADFSQTYTHNEKTIRVLFYRTQRKHKDGVTTKDECTYLEFIDGGLNQTGNGGEYSRITKK